MTDNKIKVIAYTFLVLSVLLLIMKEYKKCCNLDFVHESFGDRFNFLFICQILWYWIGNVNKEILNT